MEKNILKNVKTQLTSYELEQMKNVKKWLVFIWKLFIFPFKHFSENIPSKKIYFDRKQELTHIYCQTLWV